jgi:hypothetical protein
LTPLDPEIVASEASRRSFAYIAHRIARIETRIRTGDDHRADWLALRYSRAIGRDKRERERAGIQSSGDPVVEPVTSSTHLG